MTDLKQKEEQAWTYYFEQGRLGQIRDAVQASIAAALAPVLERVARLEELAQFPTLMAENDALLQKMAAAPCATCGGVRFVCDSGKASWGKSWPCMTPEHVEHDNRRPCPDCSKPAAGPEGTLQHNPGLGSVTMSTEQAAALLKNPSPAESEGEIACTRHGQHRCPACAAGMVEVLDILAKKPEVTSG